MVQYCSTPVHVLLLPLSYFVVGHFIRFHMKLCDVVQLFGDLIVNSVFECSDFLFFHVLSTRACPDVVPKCLRKLPAVTLQQGHTQQSTTMYV